jgi:integral membrane protein
MSKEKFNKQARLFAKISFWEGVSFLLLLFIAMPFKYLLGMPMLVRVIGMLHGILFVAYLFQLLYISTFKLWSFKTIVIYGLGSFVPFMPFWVEKQIKKNL